jgi:hypothetical protein
MKHTLKYFFSICLFFYFFIAQAQEKKNREQVKTESKKVQTTTVVRKKTSDTKKEDTLFVKKDRYGVRVGLDLFKLTKGIYDSNYKGIELVGDYRLTKKYYLAAEIGSENKTTDDERLNTTTKGTYLKVGFDYNAYENWLDMENCISIGLRYGASTFSQELNSYKIYNPNPYWGEQAWVTSDKKFNGLSASWIEVVAGVKAKVFNNVFVGFSLRLNRIISDKKPSENFQNLYIPGFNRTYDGDFGVGFNYTVSYLIPLYKKKIPLEKEMRKK